MAASQCRSYNRICTNSGCFDCLRDNREVVKTFLNEKPNDTIGVEKKVAPARCSVPDYRVESFQLSRLGECEYGWWKRRGRRLGC